MVRRWLSDPKKRWGTIAVILALWFGKSWYQGRFHPVQTAVAQRGDLILDILTSGEVEGDASDLSFNQSGAITALYVREGEAIDEGQPLARIEVAFELGRTYGSVDVIAAPYAGYVVKIHQRLGSVVQASQPVLRVVRRGGVWVTAFVDAEDASYVRPGQPFVCRSGGYLARPWDLRVESIGREAVPRENLPGSANQVRIRLQPTQPEFALPVGAEIEVDGKVPIATDELIVPAAAVSRRDGRSYVWLNVAGRAVETEVRTGPNNFRELVIERGLNPGDEVVVSGKTGLEDGALLRATPWDPDA